MADGDDAGVGDDEGVADAERGEAFREIGETSWTEDDSGAGVGVGGFHERTGNRQDAKNAKLERVI
jgi:hypothetical protein